MARTVIIDGDVLAYRVGSGLQEDFEIEVSEDDEFIYRTISWGNKRGAVDKIDTKIASILKDTKSQDHVIVLSDSEANFRKELNPKYKSNRKTIKPLLLSFLRKYLTDTYKTYIRPSLEADDVIGILATSDKIIKGDKVVWSMDKDFKTIPCKFRREAPDGSHTSKVFSEEEADWWFMYQTLIGDKVDGYDGCRGVGEKTARKLLGEVGEKSLEEMWEIVKDTYIKAGYTEEDALLNARMARILRAEDYDFKKEGSNFMANLIRSYELNKSYNINSYPQQLFVVCDTENNPVTFSPKGYGTWKKPKMMYFTEGHAKAQAHDLNRRFGEELFKVVRFVPSEEENG